MAKADVQIDINMVMDDIYSSRNAYLNMLDTISKFHKYNLDQLASLSLYAGSDFTAVADERVWVQVFHAHIKPNAKAIEILDENAPNGVKLVYDVSDTDIPEDRRENLLWRFDADRDIGVFRGIADEEATPIDSILELCWNIEDSLAGTDLSGPDGLLITESIAYVLLKRLGYEREAELLAEQTITDDTFQEATVSLQQG